jgi:uncharacterized protein
VRARLRHLDLFTSPELLLELEEVLSRPKLAVSLPATFSAPECPPTTLCWGIRRLLEQSSRGRACGSCRAIPDDAVLACALMARAEVVITGDSHLLDLRSVQGMRMLTASEFLAEMAPLA